MSAMLSAMLCRISVGKGMGRGRGRVVCNKGITFYGNGKKSCLGAPLKKTAFAEEAYQHCLKLCKIQGVKFEILQTRLGWSQSINSTRF
jgi:hypothetical protein